MAPNGPNPARQPFLFGPWSVSKYIETYKEMVLIWSLGVCLWTLLDPSRPTKWREPLCYIVMWMQQGRIRILGKIEFPVDLQNTGKNPGGHLYSMVDIMLEYKNTEKGFFFFFSRRGTYRTGRV